MTDQITLIAAFAAGLLSFFSPCVLPLVPVYLGYMAGTAAATSHGSGNLRLFLHAVFYVIGFSLVFVLLGAAAALIGSLSGRLLPVLIRVGGILLIILGLHLCGLIKIPFLYMDKHLEVDRGAKGYWASFIVGIVFAAGWTPCIGPVLASILLLAANSQTVGHGALLLAVYSLGLGIPFLVAGGLFNLILPLVRKMGRAARVFNYIGGALLIVMGFLLVTGLFTPISYWLSGLIS
ncbi:MAG: cytochrome c biogenesis CcdA family protein [Anaerolineae bacterium]